MPGFPQAPGFPAFHSGVRSFGRFTEANMPHFNNLFAERVKNCRNGVNGTFHEVVIN